MIGPISILFYDRRLTALEIFFISAGRAKKTDVYLDIQFALSKCGDNSRTMVPG